MAKTVKLILSALGIVAMLQGQQSAPPVRFATLATNLTTTGRLTNIPNIGQQVHLLVVVVSSVTSGSCSLWGGQLQLEASFNGSNWFQIGTAVPSNVAGDGSGDPVVITTSAVGTYPYLSVNYLSGNTVNCALTVNYAGYSGSPPSNTASSSFADSFDYLNGTLTSGSIVELTACVAGQNMTVYSVVLINNGASNAVLNLYIEESAPLSNTVATLPVTLAPAAQLVLPQGPRPYLRAPNNAFPVGTTTEFLYAHITGTVNVGYLIAYRCE